MTPPLQLSTEEYCFRFKSSNQNSNKVNNSRKLLYRAHNYNVKCPTTAILYFISFTQVGEINFAWAWIPINLKVRRYTSPSVPLTRFVLKTFFSKISLLIKTNQQKCIVGRGVPPPLKNVIPLFLLKPPLKTGNLQPPLSSTPYFL